MLGRVDRALSPDARALMAAAPAPVARSEITKPMNIPSGEAKVKGSTTDQNWLMLQQQEGRREGGGEGGREGGQVSLPKGATGCPYLASSMKKNRPEVLTSQEHVYAGEPGRTHLTPASTTLLPSA